MIRFIKRLFRKPLPSGKPSLLDCLFIYDLRGKFSPKGAYQGWEHAMALEAAVYSGEADPVLGLVRPKDIFKISRSPGLIIINLRKVPHHMLVDSGLLHLVENLRA